MAVTDCGTGRAHVGVDVSDVLRIALRQLDDLGTDLDGLAATLLCCAAAGSQTVSAIG